jgi:hypothetical protein
MSVFWLSDYITTPVSLRSNSSEEKKSLTVIPLIASLAASRCVDGMQLGSVCSREALKPAPLLLVEPYMGSPSLLDNCAEECQVGVDHGRYLHSRLLRTYSLAPLTRVISGSELHRL